MYEIERIPERQAASGMRMATLLASDAGLDTVIYSWKSPVSQTGVPRTPLLSCLGYSPYFQQMCAADPVCEVISPVYFFVKILLGISLWMPLVPSTSCVISKSAATLASM